MHVGVAAAVLISVQAGAAGPVAPIAKLGLANHPVELPGAWSVLGAFLMVTALAVGAALLFKRVAPRFLGRLARQNAVNVSILARERLAADTHAHVVAIGSERLLIVTSRAAVAVHALSASPPDGKVS